jgi:hypothetical protein
MTGGEGLGTDLWGESHPPETLPRHLLSGKGSERMTTGLQEDRLALRLQRATRPFMKFVSALGGGPYRAYLLLVKHLTSASCLGL